MTARPADRASAPAHQWLTTYRSGAGDPDSGWFNAEGYVRDGDMITYLVIRNAGQDYNYDRQRQSSRCSCAEAGRGAP